MKKRILSILLLCCMVLTLLPTAAFAANELPDVKLSVPATFDKTVDLTKQNGELKIKDSKTYLIKGSADPNWYFQYRIKIDGKNNTPHIFLDGVRIQAPKDGPAIELYGGASACLYFIGNDSELIGAENFAALQKNKTDGYLRVLVQTGTKLTCEGGRYGAGIGGSKVGIKKFSQGHGMNLHFGSLATGIYGGEILAISGVYGAGIGGGQGGVGEWIYVYSGKLTVRSVSEGAGIGGGQGGPGRFIYIKGGTVNAGSESGGAGIGSGDQDGQNKSEDAHHIEISGGTVEAWSNYAGAGIGGGRGGSGYDISITGGVVRAQGYYGAGIGGGMKGKSGNILIKDTTLTALALPLYPSSDYDYNYQPASAVGRGSKWVHWMTVMQDQEFAMTLEENIKIEASDGKSVRLSATGWQWRRSQREYERGWGTTTELLIGHVDLQRLSLPYAYNYGRVISELELRCEKRTCSHELNWTDRDGCHIWACVKCGARDPAAENSKQNAKHIPGDWGNQKQLCTVCGHVMGTDTKAPVLEGLKDGESYAVEDNIDGNPGAYTFTVSDPAASGETSSGIKSVTINGEPQDGPTYRLPAPDGGKNDAGAEYTVVATDNAGNETTATVRTYRWHHVKVISPDGNGTASASPDKAVAGTEITLTATPKTGYHFKEWEVESPAGLVITNNKFTMPDSDVEVKAIFEKDAPPAPTEFTITVKTDGNGTASASLAKAAAGVEITLTAEANTGYRFKEWEVESPTGPVIANNKFTMPAENVDVKAIFEELPAAEFTITFDGNSGSGNMDSVTVKAGTNYILPACGFTAPENQQFKAWQIDGTEYPVNAPVTVTADITVKALWEDAPPAPTEFTITVTSGGNGTGAATPSTATAGTTITLTATPDEGYHFKEWQAVSPTELVITNDKFLMPNDNVEVKAIFEEDAPPAPTDPAKPSISVTGTYTYNGSEHTATVSGYDPATMDISGNTATDAGDYTVRVTSQTGKWADGSTGAVTAEWKIGKATQEAPDSLAGSPPTTEGGSDGKIIGVTDMMEYRAESETIYTACTGTEIENLPAGNYFVRYAEDHNHFASPDAEVTVGKGAPLADCTITFDGNGGSGSMDSVTVKAGTNYTLPECGFTAPDDQEFKAWEIGGKEYKVGDSYTVNEDTEIKALWENSVITPTTYTVTVSNDGNGTASATPSAAEALTEITLTATPNRGYHFKEWQVLSPAGLVITNNKFHMPNGDVEIKAIFEEDAPSAEDLVDPMIRIHLIPDGGGYYSVLNGTWTAADFFQPGKAPKGAKITAVTPPTSPSIPVSVNVDSGGTLSCTKTENTTEPVFKSETYTVTITSDDYEPISAPLTVRQYLNAGFEGPIRFNDELLYGDTYTYTCRVNNPGENGVWSALIRNPDIFEIYQETTDITSEPGKSIYTVKIRAIKTGRTCIDFLYLSDTTMASSKDSSDAITGGTVSTRPLTVTAGSASITKGDALPTDLVTCTGLLDSEGRKDDRDTVLENALSYRLLDASGVEVAADTARKTPGTYTVVPAAALKSGWDERYSLNRVNGTLTVEDKVEELFTVTVKTDGNGTASATPSAAEALTEITLTATPNRGYHFKEWQVISPTGLVITNNKFTMPNDDVEIKAIFKKNTPTSPIGTGATTYPITVNSKNGDVTASHKSAAKGTTVTLTVDPDKGYVLDTLTVLDGKDKDLKLTDKGDGKFSFIMPAGKVTVEASFKEEFPDLPNPFSDLAPSDFCYDAVMWAVGRDITGGIGNDTFGPNLPCTRAQAVTFLWRAASSPEPETRVMPFTDVPVGSYYYNAVLWAIENGITEGTSDTMFSPDDTCSRAQIVTFLWRAGGSPAASGNSAFTDVASDAYYAAAVIWAEKNDITGGIGGDLFGSNNDCTRGQIVTFLYRAASAR